MAHDEVVRAIEEELTILREQVASLELALETLTGAATSSPSPRKETKEKKRRRESPRQKTRRMPATHYDGIVAGFVRTLSSTESTFKVRDVHEWAKKQGFYSTMQALASVIQKMAKDRQLLDDLGPKRTGRDNVAHLFRRRQVDPKIWKRLADNSPLYGKGS